MVQSLFEQIRVREDQEELVLLAHEIWNEHFPAIIGQAQVDYMLGYFSSLEAIQRQSRDGYQYYFIQTEGQRVGYLCYKVEGEELFLSKLYVKAAFRGRGLARKAFGFVRDQAVKVGAGHVRLTVNRDNTVAIRAYHKMGFETIDQVKMDIGGGFVMDDYVMRLDLK